MLCIVLAILTLTGFDKKDNYYNPEGSLLSSENAYVGGDAYNYIINGTYNKNIMSSFKHIRNIYKEMS